MTRRYLLPLVGSLLVGGAVAAAVDGPSRGLFGGRPEAQASANEGRPFTPAGDVERAVIAPLTEGDDLAGWTVARIGGVEGGTMRIELEKKGDRAALVLALDDGGDPRPPVVAGRYAIFYSTKNSDEGLRLATALGAVIDKHKGSGAAIPRGLTPFRPEPGRSAPRREPAE